MHLSIDGDCFLYDGQPFQILSGAVHYFRIVPGYWEDRLQKAKACGLNTIETYIPWNLHEPQKGTFCFEGIADIVRFIQIAGSLGLKVIIRPGPYICAEWDFGGLPAWLLNEKDIELRCMNKSYLRCVDAYFDVLLAKLCPFLSTNGGPIIAMQVENEYGSYGDDQEYLSYLRQGLVNRGMDILLFTSDGPTDRMLSGGTLPDVYKTINFGSKWREAVQVLSKFQKNQPHMCMEFWNGWFDHWGDEHIVRDSEDAAKEYSEMLEAGMSVNIYMLHGGTNFGFYNGANYADGYQPTVTSYDYDAPISEEGHLTPKFYRFREAIQRITRNVPDAVPAPQPKMAFGEVKLTQSQNLFACLHALSQPIRNASPLPMEKCGQNSGFILYRTTVDGPRLDCKLTMMELRDRALIFVNGVYQKSVYRNDKEQTVTISLDSPKNVLDIIVENMGRINYGPRINERKGITDYIAFDHQKHFGWEMYPLPLNDIGAVPYDDQPTNRVPTFYRGEFLVKESGDTYFCTEGWHKGVVFINGFSIGRYWESGPQKTLYIPAPLLKKGKNEIVVFDLYGVNSPVANMVDHRDLG